MYPLSGPNGHVGNTPRPRLDAGLDLLDSWAATAGQFDRYTVYRALFAVADASVSTYQVFDDHQRPHEFSVLVREDLVLKIRMNGIESFDIRYIGPAQRTEADPVAD